MSWTICPACKLRHSERADGRCPRCGHVPAPLALPDDALVALPEDALVAVPEDAPRTPPLHEDLLAPALHEDLLVPPTLPGGMMPEHEEAFAIERNETPVVAAWTEARPEPRAPWDHGRVLDLETGAPEAELPFLAPEAGALAPVAPVSAPSVSASSAQPSELPPAVEVPQFPAYVPRASGGRDVPRRSWPSGALFFAGIAVAIGAVLATVGLLRVAGAPIDTSIGAGPTEARDAIAGVALPYVLHLPISKKWIERAPGESRQNNALVDRWLTRRDLGAHVVVMVDRLSADANVDPKTFRTAALEDLRSTYDYFAVTRDQTTADGVLVESDARVRGEELHELHRFEVVPGYALHVLAFAPKSEWRDAEPEIRTIVHSLEISRALRVR